MNETMPISAGLPAGMTTDACLEAQLRSAFLTGETDGEEAGLRPEFVINDPDRRIKVLTVIEDELARCTSFDISVAFVTMSGIEPLLPIFEELRERGVPGRVLTTDYLCFSDPAAMRKLAGISNIEVRLFRAEGNRGFHTKGYIFNSGDVCRFLIGSSNLTSTALATNREWNARLVSKQTGAFARALQAEFRALWDHPLSRPLHEVIDAYEAERRAQEEANKNNGGSSGGGSGGGTTSDGSFLYPLPRSCGSWCTSPYGYRYHPISGTYTFHSGVDLAAAGGTPIYASKSGTVTTAAYAQYSWGNYVVINHGDGYYMVTEGGIVTMIARLEDENGGMAVGNEFYADSEKPYQFSCLDYFLYAGGTIYNFSPASQYLNGDFPIGPYTIKKKDYVVSSDLTLDLEVEETSSTTARIGVTPSNADETYFFDVMLASDVDQMDDAVLVMQLENVYASYGGLTNFLYKGSRYQDYSGMTAGTEYCVVAFGYDTDHPTTAVTKKIRPFGFVGVQCSCTHRDQSF